ncbi:MAG: dephospho-CoA kinase [Clostridia bacterium]|nr:dephospho-CoA kinase [Clostridia bacterium]
MAKIVGITGPSGSGKSLLSREIEKLGIPTIDADAVYHDMLIPPSRCLDAIALAFGEDILSADGSLDRTVLAAKVFADSEQLDLLNRTVLPIVIEKINKMIAAFDASGAHTVVLDAPTLIESGFYKSCDMVIAVIAPIADRTERIMKRDDLSEERAAARVASQRSDEFYTSVADITLFNDQDEESFRAAAKDVAAAISTL